jgi:predicted AlkP superfamily phosphohydrolase/phosphomutase
MLEKKSGTDSLLFSQGGFMTTRPKVLFIGLDAADPALLAQGCDAGWLPVLQSLRSQGAWTPVRGPRGFGDGALWPSLFTGVNPGRHGRYFYRQIKLGTYDIENFAEDADFGHRPFWEFVNHASRRVAIIDMIKAPLAKDLNGIQISGWMVESQEGPTRSSPAPLAAEVIACYGSDPFNGVTDVFKQRTAEEYQAFRDAMIARVHTKTALCERYLKHDSWDLFMVAFSDPHIVGHQCWHLHDPAHALYDSQWVERYGDPVKDVYRALDKAIGRLLDCTGPQTTTIVFAGLGMGSDYTGNYLFDQILRRIDGRPDRDRNLIPHALVSRLRPAVLQKLGQRINHAKSLYSMGRRQCFEIPHSESAGGVRINVVGREPAGCVKPGADYEAVCNSLTKDLLDLVNADTGGPVVKEVIRIADDCHGPRLETLPDLFAVWSREAPIRAVTSPKIGIVTGTRVIGARTGDHNPDCVLYAQGPRVTRRGPMNPMAVEDIAPTITSWLDFALPDCDGAPISFDMAN